MKFSAERGDYDGAWDLGCRWTDGRYCVVRIYDSDPTEVVAKKLRALSMLIEEQAVKATPARP